MSRASTRTIWKVTVEEGRFDSMRSGEWLFTNERAATAFANTIWAHVEPRNLDVTIEEIEVEMYANHAVYGAAQWIFPELKAAL